MSGNHPESHYTTRVRTVIERATRILLDADNVRWTQDELVDYMNEGCREIISRRPEAFATTVRITLNPGQIQRVPPQYQALFSIEEGYDRAGRGYPVVEIDHAHARLLRKPTIRSGYSNEYTIATYTKHPLDDRVFYADPPVPAGMRIEVLATMVIRPEPFTKGDLDKAIGCRPEYEAQLVDWVLHRAFLKDTDSEHMIAVSDRRLKAFNDALEQKWVYRARKHNQDSGLTEKNVAMPQSK